MQNFRFFGYQYVMVDTALAAFPESLVVCQFIESNRYVAQFGIHFHNGRSAGQTEYLALGHRRRARRKEAVLIRLASPKPR